jgi:Cu(I)/Ag(I) efflux system periplasmic protein CusF
MNRCAFAFLVLLLAGCDAAPQASAPATPAPAPAPATARHATASGVVQAVDAAAKTVSIAHGPVEALGWPAMTMTFQAPGVDLAAIRPGDAVAFEFTSTGMDGTIVAIARR